MSIDYVILLPSFESTLEEIETGIHGGDEEREEGETDRGEIDRVGKGEIERDMKNGSATVFSFAQCMDIGRDYAYLSRTQKQGGGRKEGVEAVTKRVEENIEEEGKVAKEVGKKEVKEKSEGEKKEVDKEVEIVEEEEEEEEREVHLLPIRLNKRDSILTLVWTSGTIHVHKHMHTHAHNT